LSCRFPARFLGLDSSGDALWLADTVGVFVVPLATLEARACCLWKDLRAAYPGKDVQLNHTSILLDRATRNLYVLLDASLALIRQDGDEDDVFQSCYVHCLYPSAQGEHPWEVYYNELPGEKVCAADFQIDGFSDSFCVTESCLLHLPEDRKLQVLDGGGGIWEMDL